MILVAALNRALPEALKRKILFALWPYAAEGHDVFKAYYGNCTPKKLTAIANQNGLDVVQLKTYWRSSYFNIFLPAYLFWRLYQFLAWLILREDDCESFTIVFEKKGDASSQLISTESGFMPCGSRAFSQL